MKAYTFIGHTFFAILAILSVYFYAERTIFIDSAFQIFKIINFETWNIEAGRYSAVFTQAIPLLLVKAGAPLNLVLLSYSLSFIIVFYLVFCLVTYKMKNEVAGITIVFILGLCIRQSFYHAATETHQGLIYTALLYAWLCYSLLSVSKILRYSVATLLVLLCFFSHPITLLPILFIFAFHAIDKNLLKSWEIYVLASITVLIYLGKAITTPGGSYEGDQFAQLAMFTELIPNLPNFSSTIFFAGNVNNLYYLAFILLFIVLVHYYKQREFPKLWLVLSSTFLFILITLVTFHRGDSIVMMEKNFMPLTVFIIIPFASDILAKTQIRHKLKVGGVSIAVAIGLIGVIVTGNMFSERLTYVSTLVGKGNLAMAKKNLILKDDLNMDIVMVTWGLSIETLLYSSLGGPGDCTTTYVVDNKDQIEGLQGETNLFYLTPEWRDWKISELNSNYFNLDNSAYLVISP